MSTNLSTTIPTTVTGITREQQDILAEILSDVKQSIDRLARAARRWVELPPKAREKIVEQSPPSFREFWSRLQKVGEGELHPALATIGGTAARLLGKLPLPEQDRYLRELIPVVVHRGRGWDVRLIDVAEMSDEQRRQVFKVAPDGTVTIRDEEQQKAWLAERAAREMLASQAAERRTKIERNGWKVERGRVWIKPAALEAGLTKKQLLQILRDLGED